MLLSFSYQRPTRAIMRGPEQVGLEEPCGLEVEP